MRISTSDYYHGRRDCRVLQECDRHYCKSHRMLWSDCETAQPDMEGSGRRVSTLGDCPLCELDAALKSAQRTRNAWLERHPGSCPECFNHIGQWDDVAIHMIGVHGIDAEQARLFLRDRVEETAFNEEA